MGVTEDNKQARRQIGGNTRMNHKDEWSVQMWNLVGKGIVGLLSSLPPHDLCIL